MANVSISGLPEQTGKTDNDVLAIVDSGETTTSKIKVSTLLDGIGGGAFTTAAFGTANLLPSYMDGTEISAGNYNIIVGGGDDGTTPSFDNDILNTSGWSSIMGGRNNTINQNTASYSQHTIIGGENNSVTGFGNGHNIIGSRASTATGSGANAKYNIILGGDSNNDDGWGGATIGATGASNSGRSNCVISGGQTNTITNGADDSSIVAGSGNTLSGDKAGIVGGTGNNVSSLRGAIIGGENNTASTGQGNVVIGGINNTASHSRSVVLGGNGLSSSFENEVVLEHLTINGQSTEQVQNVGEGGALTIDFDEGNMVIFAMSADTSLTLTNVKEGGRYSFQVQNNGTFSITGVTATGYNILCEGGSIPNITNNGTDLCVLEVFGTDIMVRHFTNFSTPE